jgi:hypothetical protein
MVPPWLEQTGATTARTASAAPGGSNGVQTVTAGGSTGGSVPPATGTQSGVELVIGPIGGAMGVAVALVSVLMYLNMQSRPKLSSRDGSYLL